MILHWHISFFFTCGRLCIRRCQEVGRTLNFRSHMHSLRDRQLKVKICPSWPW
ncbi:hypothetical protein M758_11G090300 [Ceratodon purpureus]|uniref:Uncharacterized protein n=1 Tax=Ceratodon purpureus TaxID=3225 RepID=A0A8T0GDA7_CERPU|nr:hypothetical protein KC19_11G093500 [Ceratodon purpureus]KAG0601179.1 hypothetical protein M758_11G090300 [Ceratodon purpureus]